MHLLHSLLHIKCLSWRSKNKFQKLFIRKLNTWLEGPGEAKGDWHGPSCNEKCAINTISFANAPLTSALGHSRRYSEKRLETLKRTLCANQKRTFLLWRSRMHRASYLQQDTTVWTKCRHHWILANMFFCRVWWKYVLKVIPKYFCSQNDSNQIICSSYSDTLMSNQK